MEHCRVKRVTLRLRDDDLVTNRLRGVGYRAVSTGGWHGPVRKVRQDAVADMYEYRSQLPQVTLTSSSAPPANTGGAA